MKHRPPRSLRLIRSALAVTVFVLPSAVLSADMPPEQAAGMVLDSARRAYNEKNYPFAAERFREFLGKYGRHKDAASAHYGLALCLIEGPGKDYKGAIQQLQPIAEDGSLKEHPFVLYYLALAERGLGTREQELADAKTGDANTHRDAARRRFEDASKHFAAAVPAFTGRIPQASKGTPTELEWAARARCDQAEMLLRLHRAKEAQAAAAPFVRDFQLRKSRYRGLGLYYHGFACFLVGDNLAAGRSLSLLTPFSDPVFGTHARYLLARVHHAAGERPEARGHYEGVIAEHSKQKQAAAEALRQPERFKNDPQEMNRLERLAYGPVPDHVARAAFFLGVLQYEDGRFAEAVARLNAFRQQAPTSPLAAEAQLHVGFCQVQLKQFAEAQRTLQPLVDRQPRLADQALLWLARAQVGGTDPANRPAYEQALKSAVDTLRKAADRAGPTEKTRRGEILLELADTQQRAHQYRAAAGTYNQILAGKLLPPREDEVMAHLATALHLTGDYAESDNVCLRFREKHPQSVLLPAVLFRHAENAYHSALAAEKLPRADERARESRRRSDEALRRYQLVIDKYPEYGQTNLARHGLGLVYYHRGELDKAKETLEAIPAADRTGDLALVSYQLADILIRQAPAKADDALAAGKLEEQLKSAIELLDGFVNSQPNGAHTADALFKLGYCQQRMAALLAQPAEQAKALTAARAAYEQILQRFPRDPVQPQAVLERAKVMAQARDMNGAINELRRFLHDPLKNAPVAPMAVVQLATLLRGQNNANEAARILAQCRQQHEQNLLKDPARAAWATLLQYHHGVALREANKRREAREILVLVVRNAADRPEAADAALRAGQCLKEEGQQKIVEASKRLNQPNRKPEDQAAARKTLEEGIQDVREAIQLFVGQAEKLRTKETAAETRARLLYEAAWGSRILGEREVETARQKIQQDLWQKQREEVAKKTPPGQKPPSIPMPEVPLTLVPLQPAEKEARKHYEALIEASADLPISADARFELAELLSERGEHDAAIKLLREALDREPAPELTDKVRLRLGDCLLRKGDVKAALGQFEPLAANRKSAAFAQAQYRAGECFLHEGNWAEAGKRFAVFRDQAPYQNLPGLTDRALLRLGYALARRKQWDASRQAYELVVARFGNGRWVHEARYGIGWAYQNRGQYDSAIHAYTQVVNQIATELAARAQMNIGLCRLAQKRYPEATSALLVVPFTYDYPHLSALSLVEAARAFAANKQPEQAIKLLERVVREHPDTESAEVARKRLEELKKS